jgi:hypothetical protein
MSIDLLNVAKYFVENKNGTLSGFNQKDPRGSFETWQKRGSSRILRNLAEERILEDPSKAGRKEDPRGSFESWQKRGSSSIPAFFPKSQYNF